MSYKATVIRVMIASPNDIDAERGIIREVIHEWNSIHSEDRRIVLLPVSWESHLSPSMGDRPQEIINKLILADTDLLIATFWTRLGSPTGNSSSGTVEEIERHLAAGKSAMIYFSSVPVRPDNVDEHQYKALKSFKEECYQKGLVETYESVLDFRQKLTRQLAQTISRFFANESSSEQFAGDLQKPNELLDLTDAAKTLLVEASQDSNGRILKLSHSKGLTVKTHGKVFIDGDDPRMQARWEHAVQQLLDNGLIYDPGYKGEVFLLTEPGYEIADHLRKY